MTYSVALWGVVVKKSGGWTNTNTPFIRKGVFIIRTIVAG